MTLDRHTPPRSVRLDSRDYCARCGDVVPLLVDGVCPYCHNQEDPMTRVEELTAAELEVTTILPDYAVDIAELLTETEGSNDATVRAVRKIVVQGAVALRALVTAAPQISGPDTNSADQVPTEPSSVPAPSGSEPTKPPRSAPESLRLMRENGVTAAQVRLWARSVGRDVPNRGQLSVDLVHTYLTEHQDVA